jgi:sugar lactone lactonase YvrE
MGHLIKSGSAIAIILLIITSSCFKQPARSPGSENLVIYPAPPAKTRIQYLTSFSTSSDIKKSQSAFNKLLFGEEEQLPIVKPYGITVHNDRIYICDTGIKGIEIIDLKNQTFEYFLPGGKGQLQFPINCHVDPEGHLYVADGNRKQVVIFDQNLKYLDAITLKDNKKPTDLYVEGSRIWVAAIDDHKIHIYNKNDRTYMAGIPKGAAQLKVNLYQPANISLQNNQVYVSDIGACKIHVFDTAMNYKQSLGETGYRPGQFTRPKGVCADKKGNIYVVDAAFENIQIFNSEGMLLMHFGGTYKAPGGMWLPADVTIDYGNLDYFTQYVDSSFNLEYLIFVTNQYGPDKVNVYGFVTASEM